jgi:hypothetical protein
MGNRSRLASFWLSVSLLVVVGLAGGCGDNQPKQTGTAGTGGGTGGTAGSGGETGTGGLAGSDAGVAGQGGLGGVTDAGTDAAIPCYGTTFTTPLANNATLTVTDDNDHTCADGFQYTVAINSDAPDGTQVTLYDGNTLLKTVSVSGHKASFDVQLSTGGTAQALSIQYPTTTACSVVTNVTVSCDNNPPTCSISKPVISATHPELNGVPAPGGDRTSATGSSYQATFTVQTSAEDGQPVTLAVDNQMSASAVTNQNATASGGTATFGVTLVPDGTYDVVATCTNKNGISGMSAKTMFTVDTTPPDLTVTKPTAGMFVFGATVDVCGQTTQMDAAGLASSLGAAQSNLCVFVGSSPTPKCGPMVAVNAPSCVTIDCPGAAPFNLTVQLKDTAGNPTSQTLTGVTCASTHPTVQIIAPPSDAPTFTDATKHILAANAPTGVKDLDPATPGAQADVVACTDMPGTAVLTVGHAGDATLNQLGSSVATVPAVTADNCPSALGNVIRFSGVTLPESNENADGTLAAATRLVVSVTSTANTANVGVSQPDDVWVDTTPPSVALVSPANLCGSFKQSSVTVPMDLVYNADYKSVVVDVTNGATTTTYDTPAFMNGVATFSGVAFTDGLNNVTVTATDPAGNATVLPPNPCAVTIGMAPVVTFTTPTAGAILCPAGATATACIDDNDIGTAGWQGSVAVTVTVAGQPVTTGDAVTFTINGNSLGGANLDANGHAQLDGITVPEGVQTIVATTGDIANAGVGMGTVTVTVDTTPPGVPTGLSAVVKDRRAATIQLNWTAPFDGSGGNVAGYQIRYGLDSRGVINAGNFDVGTTAVTYTGAPAAGGQPDGILLTNLPFEHDFYFAVRAVDVAGSVGPVLASTGPDAMQVCRCDAACCPLRFMRTTLASGATASESFGFEVDAQGDLNGDKVSDVLVATVNAGKAYMFYGGATATATVSTPSVKFTGPLATFGEGVAQIGDFDGDGTPDVAIGDPGNATVPPAIYIFKGPADGNWPMTVDYTTANYIINTDSTYINSLFGVAIAPIGDFNGDGVADFAVGARSFGASNGRVVIILGKSGFPHTLSLPEAAPTAPDTYNSIVIDGDSSVGKSRLGYRVVGLGNFYSAPMNQPNRTTLAVSAPGSATSASNGRVYVFRGQPTPANGTISITSADATFVGNTGTRVGQVLSNMSTVLGGNKTVGIGASTDATDFPGSLGVGIMTSGTSATGPFVNQKLMGMVGHGQSVGVVFLGGGLSGQDTPLSLIGSSTPDVVLGAATSSPVLTISDGDALAGRANPVDAYGTADVLVSLPTGTTISEAAASLAPDVNGDIDPMHIYPDFCVGNTVQPGSVICFW